MARVVELTLAVVLTFALTACAGSAAGPTTGSPAREPTDSAATSEADGAPVTVPDGFSPYWPVAIGNTWVYQNNYYGFDEVRFVTETRTIASVEPDGEDFVVEFAREFHFDDGAYPDFADSFEVVLHADGSATLPYESLPLPSQQMAGAYVVDVMSGTIEWPTASALDAGSSASTTIVATLSQGTVSLEQTTVVTVTGEGHEDVTIALGTFASRRLGQHLLASHPQVGEIPSTATTWIADGTGPVRTIVVDEVFGSEIVTIELLQFIPA